MKCQNKQFIKKTPDEWGNLRRIVSKIHCYEKYLKTFLITAEMLLCYWKMLCSLKWKIVIIYSPSYFSQPVRLKWKTKDDTLKVNGVLKILDSTDFPFIDTQYPQTTSKLSLLLLPLKYPPSHIKLWEACLGTSFKWTKNNSPIYSAWFDVRFGLYLNSQVISLHHLLCGEQWFGSLYTFLLICLTQRRSRPTVITLHSNTNRRVSLRVSSNHLHSVLHYAVRNGPVLCQIRPVSHRSQTVFHLKCRQKKKNLVVGGLPGSVHRQSAHFMRTQPLNSEPFVRFTHLHEDSYHFVRTLTLINEAFQLISNTNKWEVLREKMVLI